MGGQPDFDLAFGQRHGAVARCRGGAGCRYRRRVRAVHVIAETSCPQDSDGIQFVDAALEGGKDAFNIGVGMRCREEARKAVLNVDATLAQMIEQERRERMFRVQIEIEPAGVAFDRGANATAGEQRVEAIDQARSSIRQVLLQPGAVILQVIENCPRRCEQQRVAHECAGKESDAGFGDRIVAVIPVAAVQCIHEFRLTGQHAHG